MASQNAPVKAADSSWKLEAYNIRKLDGADRYIGKQFWGQAAKVGT